MPEEIEFKRGEFRQFRATVKVHLGKIERDVFEGDVIGFDGQTVDIGGEKFAISTVRAAIKKGLFVEVEDTTSRYKPPSAPIVMHDPEGKKDAAPQEVQMVEDDELVVSNLNDANLGQREGQIVPETEAGGVPVAKARATKPAQQTFADQGEVVAKVQTQVEEVGDQEGVPVAAFSKPAVQETKLTAANIGSELRKAEAPRKSAPKSKTTAKQAAAAVAAAKKSKDADPVPNAPKAQPRKRGEKPGTVQVAEGVAWDMTLTWQKRAKLATTEYKNQPEVLRGIMEVETSQGVINRIQEVLDTPPSE